MLPSAGVTPAPSNKKDAGLRPCFFPSPCKGEDQGEGPIAARYYARDSGFCFPL
jgi:hypothetical protein